MRSFLLIFFCSILWFGCKPNASETPIEDNSLDWVENATIYEVNLRQYSEDGDIDNFIPHLDRLSDLGVDVLWFMPIHPIGVVNRKALGDVFAQDIADTTERKKYLGSPYSVRDYRAVNPDFGTAEDFRNLVKACHEKGFKVLIDWVGNHTSFDHKWITDHPEWYTHKDGVITDPLNADGESIGWTDVADLNYENKELWKAMTADMKFWVDSCDIDGFRCDVAFEVPAEFWRFAVGELRKSKNVFMLAEAQDHNMELFDGTFDAYYAWSVHHFMNELTKGNITADSFIQEWMKMDTTFGEKAFPMNFITNHDENSWNGTIAERMGDNWQAAAVLSFALKGMPLIYSGQEVGLNHRLKFFEKDLINWDIDTIGSSQAFYKSLAALKGKPSLGISKPIVMAVENKLLTVQRGQINFVFNFTVDTLEQGFPTGQKNVTSYLWDKQKLAPGGYYIEY